MPTWLSQKLNLVIWNFFFSKTNAQYSIRLNASNQLFFSTQAMLLELYTPDKQEKYIGFLLWYTWKHSTSFALFKKLFLYSLPSLATFLIVRSRILLRAGVPWGNLFWMGAVTEVFPRASSLSWWWWWLWWLWGLWLFHPNRRVGLSIFAFLQYLCFRIVFQDRHDDHVNGNWWWPHANARFSLRLEK